MSGHRTGARPGQSERPEHPLRAAAQIVLGVSLSCLISALAFGALIGAIALVAYLLK